MTRRAPPAMATAADAARIVDELGGPFGVVGRIAGLGADEIQAGVPGWAWFGAGIVGGIAVGYYLHDRIEAFVER